EKRMRKRRSSPHSTTRTPSPPSPSTLGRDLSLISHHRTVFPFGTTSRLLPAGAGGGAAAEGRRNGRLAGLGGRPVPAVRRSPGRADAHGPHRTRDVPAGEVRRLRHGLPQPPPQRRHPGPALPPRLPRLPERPRPEDAGGVRARPPVSAQTRPGALRGLPARRTGRPAAGAGPDGEGAAG